MNNVVNIREVKNHLVTDVTLGSNTNIMVSKLYIYNNVSLYKWNITYEFLMFVHYFFI